MDDFFDEALVTPGAGPSLLGGDYRTTAQQVHDLHLTHEDVALAAYGIACAALAREDEPVPPGHACLLVEGAMIARRLAAALTRKIRAGASYPELERTARRLCDTVEDVRAVSEQAWPASGARQGGGSLLVSVLEQELELAHLQLERIPDHEENLGADAQMLMQAITCRLHIAFAWSRDDVLPSVADRSALDVRSAVAAVRDWRTRHAWAIGHLHDYREDIPQSLSLTPGRAGRPSCTSAPNSRRPSPSCRSSPTTPSRRAWGRATTTASTSCAAPWTPEPGACAA